MRSYLEEIVEAPLKKTENTTVGIRCADHATPSPCKKFALTSPTSGGRSVDIVRLRAKATEFVFCLSDKVKYPYLQQIRLVLYVYNSVLFNSIYICAD
jgi:hypothetical protein